ncbi:hypothetical protein evm_014679 [Chilo suppressalis]|nr:hypothetical protein evm_014679 [Chilo suppressalis]
MPRTRAQAHSKRLCCVDLRTSVALLAGDTVGTGPLAARSVVKPCWIATGHGKGGGTFSARMSSRRRRLRRESECKPATRARGRSRKGEGGGAGGDTGAIFCHPDKGIRTQKGQGRAWSHRYLSCYLVQPAPGIEYKAEDESPIDCYVKVMTVYIRSGSALQRLVGGLVVCWWARHTRRRRLYPPALRQGTTRPSQVMTVYIRSGGAGGGAGGVLVGATHAPAPPLPARPAAGDHPPVAGDDGIHPVGGGLVVCWWARHTRRRRLYPPALRQGTTRPSQVNGEQASDKDRHISSLAPPLLTSTLHAALNQTLYYDEVALNCNR